MMKKLVLIAFVLIFVLYFIIFGVGFFIFANLNLSSWGDIFALGQLLVELCIIPVTVIGFMLTFNELKESQEKARLDLTWQLENSFSKKASIKHSREAKFETPQLILTNNGNIPSVYYRISLKVPNKFGKAKIERWTHSHITELFQFSNTNEFISFPNSPLNLGIIEFLDSERLPPELILLYTIHSEKGQFIQGKLIIRFVE